jgi:hypothetical protein
MSFEPLKLKPESGATLIKDESDAHAFMMHMNLGLQNKPHWQIARQTLGQYAASKGAEVKAWRAFRDAAKAEGGSPNKQPGTRALHCCLEAPRDLSSSSVRALRIFALIDAR